MKHIIDGQVVLSRSLEGPLAAQIAHVAPEQALAQAAHHAPQFQLYGRGLAQATGMRVKEPWCSSPPLARRCRCKGDGIPAATVCDLGDGVVCRLSPARDLKPLEARDQRHATTPPRASAPPGPAHSAGPRSVPGAVRGHAANI